MAKRKNEIWTPEQFRNRMKREAKEPKRNKYNAQASSRGNTRFDSKLEKLFHDELTANNIPFEFQKKFVLLPTLQYRPDEKKTRQRSTKVDFWLPSHNVLVDTKGVLTEASSLRFAMLKHVLSKQKNPPALCLIRKGQVHEFIVFLQQANYMELIKNYRL